MHPYHHPLFIDFIVYFNRNQDFFECHEVLEKYWKSIDKANKTHPITAFILLATGLYHWRRGNMKGAYRTIKKAKNKFCSFHEQFSLFTSELAFDKLLEDVQKALQAIEEALPFQSFTIEVTTTELNEAVDTRASEMHLLPFESSAIIHKHMLRDRSDILQHQKKSTQMKK